MAETVQDLLDLLQVKLHGFKYSFSGGFLDEIKALNAAKHKVWQSVIAAGRANNGHGNWFVEETDLPLNGIRDALLPIDCHDVAFVESTTGGWEGVQFKAGDFYKQTWQEQRRQAGTVGPDDAPARFFIVRGPRRPTFMLDRIPNAAINLHVLYTATLAEWTKADDDISKLPPVFRDAVCNGACRMLIASDQDPAMMQVWDGQWKEDLALITAIAHDRQIADNVTSEPYDRAG